MPTQIKLDMVADLKAQFSQASSIFITDYSGLTVGQITKLRKTLRESGIKYVVAKNTLMRIAAHEAGYDDLDQYLSGPVAVAFSTAEANVPAKILYDACKEFDNIKKPEVKAFYIDRRNYAGKDAERIAKLPPREILLSQLVATIESPISSLVGTLDGIIRNLVGTVDAIARQKGGE
jgi:large subunit ribosomal protein L10